jgi:hypothetical protein
MTMLRAPRLIVRAQKKHRVVHSISPIRHRIREQGAKRSETNPYFPFYASSRTMLRTLRLIAREETPLLSDKEACSNREIPGPEKAL